MDRIQDYLGREERLLQARRLHDYLWQELADYLLPSAASISLYRTPGERRTQRLYDSTGLTAAAELAATIYGTMTNPATNWMSLEFESDELQDGEGALWLEQVGHLLLSDYARSNAYQIFHEADHQLVVFGTSCIYADEMPSMTAGWNGYRFMLLPIGTFCIEEGASGRIDTVARTIALSARQAAQEFGYAALAPKVKKDLEDPKKQDDVTQYLHMVAPREPWMRQGKRGQRGMAFESVYVDKANKHIVMEGGYEEFPFFVTRWAKTVDNTQYGTGQGGQYVNSPWGYGPGHLALPDVKTLNKIKEWGLLALPIHLYPPAITDDDSVIGTFDMTPGAINVVRRGAQVTPYQLGGNPRLVEMDMAQLVSSIERIFLRDQILALPKAGEGQMTAFEVAQRIERTQQVMGPMFSRLTYEQFDPMAARTFGLRLRAGAIPEMPYEVAAAAAEAGGRIRVKYEGPLAKAQRASELDAIMRTYQFAGSIAQMMGDARAFEGLNEEEAVRVYAEIIGVPAKVLRSLREVAQMRVQRQQAAQQQAEQAGQVQASEAARNTAPFLREIQSGAGAA